MTENKLTNCLCLCFLLNERGEQTEEIGHQSNQNNKQQIRKKDQKGMSVDKDRTSEEKDSHDEVGMGVLQMGQLLCSCSHLSISS